MPAAPFLQLTTRRWFGRAAPFLAYVVAAHALVAIAIAAVPPEIPDPLRLRESRIQVRLLPPSIESQLPSWLVRGVTHGLTPDHPRRPNHGSRCYDCRRPPRLAPERSLAERLGSYAHYECRPHLVGDEVFGRSRCYCSGDFCELHFSGDFISAYACCPAWAPHCGTLPQY
jgi:hypothetical protein